MKDEKRKNRGIRVRDFNMNWYKQASPRIVILDHDADGTLQAIVNGVQIVYKNVDADTLRNLKRYITFWQTTKAMNILNELKARECIQDE